jgi:2-oxoglutarate dehydrogenase E1 component
MRTHSSLTSFLYGGNASYIEDLHARYEADAASVERRIGEFFKSLKDDPRAVAQNANGPSWQRPIWHAGGELIAALTGDWGEVEHKITGKIAAAQAKGVELSPPASSRRRAIRSAP